MKGMEKNSRKRPLMKKPAFFLRKPSPREARAEKTMTPIPRVQVPSQIEEKIVSSFPAPQVPRKAVM